jgi:acyl-CoA thioesterase I
VQDNGLSVLLRFLLSWRLALVSALAVAACSSSPPEPAPPVRGGAPAAPPSAPVSPAGRPRVVALGDSLTAGLGIAKDQAYPAVLQRKIDEAGLRYEVVNAGVSGDTSAGGLSRLDWAIDGDVRVLIVALGGNDGLRGLPVAQMQRNLGAIIERAQQRRIKVLLAGMESLTNMGPQYQQAFHEVFPALARQYRVVFVPFLLEGVAGRENLNQPDGIHPTPAGARLIAEHLWPFLQPLLATP